MTVNKETYINTLVDSMSMEDFKQYVKNDMADFLCYCSESEVIKNEFLPQSSPLRGLRILSLVTLNFMWWFVCYVLIINNNEIKINPLCATLLTVIRTVPIWV